MVETRPVKDITIGKRYRSDLGDIADLVQSIAAHGLIHAIAVDDDGTLICGHRRLEAWKIAKPGKSIPIAVVDSIASASERLQLERDENICREALRPVDLYNLGMAIDTIERPKAAAAQAFGSLEPNAREVTAPKVAAAIGISRPQWKRLKALGGAAENGDVRAAQLLEEHNEGAKTLSTAYKEWRESIPMSEQGRAYAATRKAGRKAEAERVNASVPPPRTRSLSLPIIERFLKDIHHLNVDNALAWEIDEATEAGDDAWLTQLDSAARALADRAQSLLMVVRDATYRDERRRGVSGERRPGLSIVSAS